MTCLAGPQPPHPQASHSRSNDQSNGWPSRKRRRGLCKRSMVDGGACLGPLAAAGRKARHCGL
jgi:hypothetical protein